ncbi:MAG: sulfotransferase domain-containing protein [Leptospirillia bacterium]
MIVLIASTPRTGSMWTYNVTRALLSAAGHTVLPTKVPKDERELLTRVYSTPPQKNATYCIKTHTRVRPGLPDTRVITTYRDMREVLLSLMRFTRDNDFEAALARLPGLMEQTDFYFDQHREHILRLRFDDIMDDPGGVLKSINAFLDLGVDDATRSGIVSDFSKEQVSKRLKALEQVAVDGRGDVGGKKKKAYDTVQNKDGSYRVFDRATSFQSGHITSKGKAEWREVFTPEQQDRINEIAGDWLKKYGFSV